ncbi:MAG: hypothetical protein H0W45_00745, partial [Acidobacteria bacterium]|nr:hypothetical protein [Acidobacteriota bacterium]
MNKSVFMSLLLQKYKIIFPAQFKVFNYRRAALLIVFALLITLSFSVVGFAQEVDEEQTEAVLIFNKGQDAHEKGD